MKKPLANPTDTYLIGMSLVNEKLARLQALADDHFGADPDRLNWGHVGSLRHIDELLTQALDHIDPARIEPAGR